MGFKNIGSMRKRRKEALRKGMKVKVLGNSDVGIESYDAVIVSLSKNYVVVKDNEGEKEEVPREQIMTKKQFEEEGKYL